MRLKCPITGMVILIQAFSGIDYPERTRIHPTIEYLSHNQTILRMGKFGTQEFVNGLSDNELILATGALIYMNPQIQIHCPFKPNLNILRQSFTRLYSATAFCNSYARKHQLPGYSINSSTNDLGGLLLGWLDEIDEEKASVRKRYREEILSRMEDRFNRKLRKKLFAGKSLFHHLIDYKQLEWLFDCMGIPKDDWDLYREILYADVWKNLQIPKVTTYLLELEKYLEDWFSMNNHKSILARHIHKLIGDLMDLGAALPKEYYVKDADGNIESTEYGKQESFRKVIKPKLIFKPIFAEVATKAPTADRPKREEFVSVREYAAAILIWNRKNILK